SAFEALTFMQFSHAGTYRMGVNSDDGFVVSAGTNPKDRFALKLGEFSGGRGASDTTFYFYVPSAGIYPVRLMWENGGGGANCEWFTIDPTNGVKTLVNDPSGTNTSGVRAYYIGPALPAFVSHINPYLNAGNVRPDRLIVQL